MKKTLFLALALAVVFGGCASENAKEKQTPVKPTSLHKSVFINDIRLEAATIKETFSKDEIVPVRISVTNTGSKAAKLTIPSGQTHEITAQDSSGNEVWRWSKGQMFTQAIQEINIEPGVNYNYFGKIEAGILAPGAYKITAWSKAQELLEEKISLVITIK